MNSLAEIRLTQTDRERMKDEIKANLFVSFGICIILMVVATIVLLLIYVLSSPAEGFVMRCAVLLSLTLVPFLAMAWVSFRKWIDLKRDLKLRFDTRQYRVTEIKNGFELQVDAPVKFRADLYSALHQQIRPTEQLTIEVTKASKTILFISHNDYNLLDKAENEEAGV